MLSSENPKESGVSLIFALPIDAGPSRLPFLLGRCLIDLLDFEGDGTTCRDSGSLAKLQKLLNMVAQTIMFPSRATRLVEHKMIEVMVAASPHERRRRRTIHLGIGSLSQVDALDGDSTAPSCDYMNVKNVIFFIQECIFSKCSSIIEFSDSSGDS